MELRRIKAGDRLSIWLNEFPHGVIHDPSQVLERIVPGSPTKSAYSAPGLWPFQGGEKSGSRTEKRIFSN